MTEMSDPRRCRGARSRANRARSKRRPHLARALHRLGAVRVAMLSIFSVGCIIPPSLSVDNQDAGVNSPPAIVQVNSDQQELPEPGPVLFTRGSGKLTLTLLDTDVDNTLFVRVFVNYKISDPTAPRASCTASPGTVKRTCTADLAGLCKSEDVGLAEPLDMAVVVFDREPLDSGAPVFQAMPPEGLSTGKFFHLNCAEP
jgi:hypothetical protein